MKVDLTGKVAVVTGGGGILCSVMSKSLAAAGAKVAIIDLRKEAAQKVADEITAQGGTAIAVGANVLEAASLKAAQEEITAALGPCDILVNGAGGNNPRGTTSREYLLPEDLKGKIEGVTTFFDLDPAGVGFVFNISSMNAFRPLTKIPAYSGAKAAISNFTQWLAVHFSKVGIRVNAIAPGFFLTDQNRTLLTNADGSLTARGKTILSHTPAGRFGVPEDLTGALLFLCDQAASFINGVVLPIDGAFAAFSGV